MTAEEAERYCLEHAGALALDRAGDLWRLAGGRVVCARTEAGVISDHWAPFTPLIHATQTQLDIEKQLRDAKAELENLRMSYAEVYAINSRQTVELHNVTTERDAALEQAKRVIGELSSMVRYSHEHAGAIQRATETMPAFNETVVKESEG
jgi:hypothetical protein